MFVPSAAGPDRDPVVLTFQPATVDKDTLGEQVGTLPPQLLRRAVDGVTTTISIPW